MGGAAGPVFTQAAERGEEMAQTLEGLTATGRALGWRAAARLGSRTAPATRTEVTMPAGPRGEAEAS